MTEQKLINSIKQSFKKYKEHGSRSPKKLYPLHTFLAETVKQIFGHTYTVHYGDGNSNREEKVIGKYYDKKIDITIKHDQNVVFCLGVKFVTSNFAQNANNYFENMMGETANIQVRSIPYAQIIILRDHTPYYNKNGEIKKIELIKEHHLEKYRKLASDTLSSHRPSAICIFTVKITEPTITVEKINIKEKFTDNSRADSFIRNTSFENLKHKILDVKSNLN